MQPLSQAPTQRESSVARPPLLNLTSVSPALCGANDKPFLSPDRQASARLRPLTYSSRRPFLVRIFSQQGYCVSSASGEIQRTTRSSTPKHPSSQSPNT